MKKGKLKAICIILSIFTLIAYHIPFFRHATANTENGFNGIFIIVSLAVLMAVLNYFFYYLVLYSGRFIGKCILAFTFIADAVSLYFINSYEVLITDKMMGNVFNTQYSEASGFFSLSAVLYVVFLGIAGLWFIQEIPVKYRNLIGNRHIRSSDKHAELAMDRQELH